MEKSFQFTYREYKTLDHLPLEIQELMQFATEAREDAYAPYSNFLVGAAIRDSLNNIYTGNNQENAAYPSGLCAERVAIYHAAAINPKATFIDLAVCVRSTKKIIDYPTAPCGACRQALAEYESKQTSTIRIFFMGEEGSIIQVSSVQDLLPFLFNKRSFL